MLLLENSLQFHGCNHYYFIAGGGRQPRFGAFTNNCFIVVSIIQYAKHQSSGHYIHLFQISISRLHYMLSNISVIIGCCFYNYINLSDCCALLSECYLYSNIIILNTDNVYIKYKNNYVCKDQSGIIHCSENIMTVTKSDVWYRQALLYDAGTFFYTLLYQQQLDGYQSHIFFDIFSVFCIECRCKHFVPIGEGKVPQPQVIMLHHFLLLAYMLLTYSFTGY